MRTASFAVIPFVVVPMATVQTETITGKVVRIVDRDTLTLLVDHEQIKIRLWGIDAPEKSQPLGTKAQQALSDLAFGRTVRVEIKDNDRSGRTVGRVYVGDTDVNLGLVRRGLAWWYRHYAPRTRDLSGTEGQAGLVGGRQADTAVGVAQGPARVTADVAADSSIWAAPWRE